MYIAFEIMHHKTYLKSCAECGQPFTAFAVHAKFCSELCDRAYQRRRSLIWRQSEEGKIAIEKSRQKLKAQGKKYRGKFEEEKREYIQILKTMPPEELIKHIKNKMAKSDLEFQPELVNPREGEPIQFVVGERPGKRERPSAATPVWAESKSGKLMRIIVGATPNVYLTNVVNSWSEDPKVFLRHLTRLQEDITRYRPTKIICFGNFAYKHVKSLKVGHASVVKFEHPSYVLRFKTKEIEKYMEEVRQQLLRAFS